MINLNKLDTEVSNARSKAIDTMTTQQILTVINDEDKTVAQIIESVISDIEKAVDCAYSCLRRGGRLIYFGAGTSGRLGVLDASECPPTYGVPSTMVQGIIAGGDQALRVAQERIEDSQEKAVQDLESINLGTNDCVCGLAASGRTPYVIGGLKYARHVGAKSISICCVQNGEISKYSDFPIEAVVGPEVVTGSTRMKAGTAQKMILNMISTTCMIKLGKVYGNYMVDLKPTNAKLIERAKQMLVTLASCSYEEAGNYLALSGNSVKIALLMMLIGEDKSTVERLLQSNGDSIANVLKLYKEK
ncbi:N-acetylmuramic acid 6-phosphate etherase [Aerococcaceae bacterium NML191219]|nr:N-acetylmuramic acid 6-phosphate etherase [Aerococcaceae bacterium NML191219]